MCGDLKQQILAIFANIHVFYSTFLKKLLESNTKKSYIYTPIHICLNKTKKGKYCNFEEDYRIICQSKTQTKSNFFATMNYDVFL